MFPANIPNKIEKPVPEQVIEPEPSVEPVTEPEIIPERKPEFKPAPEPVSEDKPPKTQVDIDVYKPTGPDTGITLCAILLSLILVGLVFLIWHETTWKQQEEQNGSVNVEPEYDGLRIVVSNYVKDMKDPNKYEYLQEIRQVYIDAANSKETDINQLIDGIYDKTHDILGFEKPRRKTKYEWEYQKLFDNTGVINAWLMSANVIITPQNKKAIFMAVAEGLK